MALVVIDEGDALPRVIVFTIDPVNGFVGEQGQPLVKAPLVEEVSLPVDERLDLTVAQRDSRT
jgi:hypothetical protein